MKSTMKKLLFFITAIIGMSMIVACSKDDDNNSTSSIVIQSQYAWENNSRGISSLVANAGKIVRSSASFQEAVGSHKENMAAGKYDEFMQTDFNTYSIIAITSWSKVSKVKSVEVNGNTAYVKISTTPHGIDGYRYGYAVVRVQPQLPTNVSNVVFVEEN